MILSLSLIFCSAYTKAAPMILVFDGLVDTATRIRDTCLQPCDAPVQNNPALPNREVYTRTETRAKFQAVFKVNWHGDPITNNWDSSLLESRIQVYDSESRIDTHVFSYINSDDVPGNVVYGDEFSIIRFGNSLATGTTATWNQYNSSGSLDLYAHEFIGNWRYKMQDPLIVDPRIEIANKAVSIRNHVRGEWVDNTFSVSEKSPFGFHYFLYELEGMTDVTLTTYYGDTFPDLAITEVPIPASIWFFFSGLVALVRVVRYNK